MSENGTHPSPKEVTEEEEDDIVTELNGLVHTPPSSMADIAERLTQSKTPPPQPNRGTKRNILVGRGNAKLTTRPASTPLRIASPVGDVHATRRSVSRASSRIQQGSRMDIVEDDKSKGVLASVTQDEDSVRKVLSISERTRKKVQHDRSQTSNKSLQRQCEVAAAFLKQRKILLITGKVGGGRTRIATELQLALTTVKDDVLPLHFKVPSDLNLLLNNSINAVVVIPDCFGTGKLDTAKVSEFQRLTETVQFLLGKNRLILILTSENDVMSQLNENQELLSFFSKEACRFDMESNENKLTIQEKYDLLSLQLKKLKIPSTIISDVSQLDINSSMCGFSLLCSLSVIATIDIPLLFENPLPYVVGYVNKCKEEDFASLILLVLLLIMDGKYPVSGLSNKDKTHFMHLLELYTPRKCAYVDVTNCVNKLKSCNLVVENENEYLALSSRIVFLAVLEVFMQCDFQGAIGVLPLSALQAISFRIGENIEDEVASKQGMKITKRISMEQCTTLLQIVRNALDNENNSLRDIASLELWDMEEFVKPFFLQHDWQLCLTFRENGLPLSSFLVKANKILVTSHLIQACEHIRSVVSPEIRTSIGKTVAAIIETGMHIDFQPLLRMCNPNDQNVVKAAVSCGNIRTLELVCSPDFPLQPSLGDALRIACKKGKIVVVKFLLQSMDQNSISILKSTKDSDGSQLIRSAVIGGEYDILNLLEKAGFSLTPNFKNGLTILHIAGMYGRTALAKSICSRFSNLITSTDDSGFTSAHYAAREGHVDTLALLVSLGVDPSLRVHGGNTVFHLAAANGHTSVLRYIWNKSAAVKGLPNDESFTPQQIAAKNGRVQAMEFFLKTEIDPNERTLDGRGFLHLAAFDAQIGLVMYLAVKYPQMTETIDRDGNTPAHDASASGSVQVLSFLVENYIDPYVVSKDGCTLLHEACYYGHLDTVKYICQNFKKLLTMPSANGYTAWHASALGGFDDILTFLLNSGANIRAVSDDGSTILHEAAFAGHLKMVEYILSIDHGLLYVKNQRSYVASHFAAQEGRLDVLRKLLTEMVDDRFPKTAENQTYLHIASFNGQMDVVRHLCTEYPELLSNQDVNGAHCIHYAARGGHIDALEYLISRGSDPMSTTNAASTILHLAAFDGHLEMANYICDKYPSLLNALDGTGHNVAHYSAGSGNLVLLKLFISKGIDPLALTTNGSTLLLKAAYSGKLDIIQYICTSFPSTVSSKDEFGCTALHYTTSGGHIKALKYLIKQGMNVMAKTNDGHTVLHMAAYNGHLKIVKFLCESYPDLISMADNGGAYSGEYAKLSENADIVRYLKSLRRGSNVNRSELGCCKSQSWIGALAQGCSAVLCFCRRN